MKLELSRQIFEKYSYIKFDENSFSESLICKCGRTDRHDKANIRFSQFVSAHKKYYVILVLIVIKLILWI
jgi:hypothetical protein